ncbi:MULTISPECIES: hypothetical protein [unclassified Blastococcus]
MRIRRLAVAATVAALPFSLSACGGGASVEDFCDRYASIDELGDSDAAEIKAALEELAGTVPDEAGAEVAQAVETMAEVFPSEGRFEEAMESGDLSLEELQELGEAGETVSAYAEENCS